MLEQRLLNLQTNIARVRKQYQKREARYVDELRRLERLALSNVGTLILAIKRQLKDKVPDVDPVMRSQERSAWGYKVRSIQNYFCGVLVTDYVLWLSQSTTWTKGKLLSLDMGNINKHVWEMKGLIIGVTDWVLAKLQATTTWIGGSDDPTLHQGLEIRGDLVTLNEQISLHFELLFCFIVYQSWEI